MLGRFGVVAFIILLAAACSSSDDAKPSTGATAAASRCHSIPNADDFCTCEVITTAPSDEIPACDATGSANIACCMQPGSTGAGDGHGLCGRKHIPCSEFP